MGWVQEARVEGVLGREETRTIQCGIMPGVLWCVGEPWALSLEGSSGERLVRVMEPWLRSLDPQAELALLSSWPRGSWGF